MKKFYTSIPLQVGDGLKSFVYKAIGNDRLQMENKTAFPIVTAINGYVQPGEDFEVIAYYTDNEPCRTNMARLKQEIADLCAEKGLSQPVYRTVAVGEDIQVRALADQFRSLIPFAADEDELFCDVTYGTKLMSMVLKMAVQYAYSVKENTVLSCILYGEISRPSKDESTWSATVVDETALVQLDELVHGLAARKVRNPEAIIDSLLNL